MTTNDKISTWFCSLGPIGFLPGPSGTWGSLVAAILAPCLFLSLSFPGRIALLAVLFVLGGLAATAVEKRLGTKDPGQVVVDELIGQWVTFLPFPYLPTGDLVLGFFLFRVFDVLKPPPVRASETWLPGGFGIMIDDVLAGLYAYACLGIWVLLRGGL